MNISDAEIKDCIKFSEYIAVKYFEGQGVHKEDLNAEALYAVAIAIQTHDHKKSKLSSWVFSTVHMYLRAFIQKEARHFAFNQSLEQLHPDEIPNVEKNHGPFMAALGLMVQSISNEAQEMLEALLKSPHEIVGHITCKARFQTFTIKTLGISRHKASKIVLEIETAFRQMV